MKTFLRGILTTILVLVLMTLGFTLSTKKMITSTADNLIKNEMKKTIIETIENETKDELPDNTKKKIEDTITNNKSIQEVMDKNLDSILDMIGNQDSTEKIDITEDLDSLVEVGEEILKEYDIELSEEAKEEIISSVSKEEINDTVNKMIKEAKTDIPEDTKTMIQTYQYVSGTTFKMILVGIAIILLLLIALLKKSYYGWLSNFGIAAVITGIMSAFLLPLTISALVGIITEGEIVISTTSLSIYGYILLGLGIISIFAKKFIQKSVTTKEAQ